MTTDEVRALIAAEKATTERPPERRMVLQTDWCLECLGPLGVHDIDTCAGCRRRNQKED